MKSTIDMIEEAGLFVARENPRYYGASLDSLKAFEALVRADAKADEREACAKVCEAEWSNVAERMYGEECAAVIRARSKDEK